MSEDVSSTPAAQATADDDQILDLVDIEECGKSGKKPPEARRYRIRIDKPPFQGPIGPIWMVGVCRMRQSWTGASVGS